MQLFNSSKKYIFASGVYVLYALMRLYNIIIGFRVVPTVPSAVEDLMTGLITVIMFAYLISLVRKTSIRIERVVIIITLFMFVTDFARLLAKHENTWFVIPENGWIETTIACIAAMLVIVRTSTIVRHRNDGIC
jgi:hypothetical protein